MQQEKNQTDNYRPKNMTSAVSLGIHVERGGQKKGKKRGPNPNLIENFKISNYEVLKRLGFDRDFIDENRRLGLKER